LNKAAKAARRDSIWQGNCDCDSSQAFDIHYGARMSRPLTLKNQFNTHKSNCPAKSRGGSVQWILSEALRPDLSVAPRHFCAGTLPI